MTHLYNNAPSAPDYIPPPTELKTHLGLILGSRLRHFANPLPGAPRIPYAENPPLPPPPPHPPNKNTRPHALPPPQGPLPPRPRPHFEPPPQNPSLPHSRRRPLRHVPRPRAHRPPPHGPRSPRHLAGHQPSRRRR